MAYPIKNTTIAQTNSLLKKNLAIGVNQGGYGLTSSTGFWNGKTPNIGGYVTYIGNGASSPTMYISTGDAQLIALSIQLGGSGITTIGDALNYLNFAGGNYISVNIDCPNVITSGLTVYLDAGYTPSYPRSTILWKDLSGNDYNFTLLNGVTYSNPGILTLDGTNDAIQLTGNTALKSTKTVVMWLKTTKTQGIFLTGEVPPATGGYYLGGYFSGSTVFLNSNCGGSITSYVDCNVITNPNLYIDGTYHMWEFKNLDFSTWSDVWNWGGYSANWQLGGDVISIMMYNRNLTAQESLQNYYAGFQKFIPTDNVAVWLDGTNTNTRVITPTTAYDGSGSNYNGAFVNGAALAHRDGGTVFNFDGIDDKLTTSLTTLNSSSTWILWIKRIQSMSFYNMFMSMGNVYFAYRSDGVIQFSNLIGLTQRDVLSSPSLTDNVWYSFAFTSSFSLGNTTMGFYLNGVLQTQSTYAGQQPTSTSPLIFGDWAFASYPFNGRIGDVRVYNRALTSTEISTIYTAGRPRYGL